MPDQDKNAEVQRAEALVDGFPVEAYVDLLVAAFPDIDPDDPITGVTDDVEIAPSLRALVSDPSMIVVSIEESGRLVGCSIAMSAARMDPSREDAADTAYIYFTAIDPSRQGNKLVGAHMTTLFEKIVEQGYSYIEQDCVIENGYADNVQQNYVGAIVDSHDHNNYPEAGPERFFRIELGRLAFKKTRAED